ncbi:hypothetical protein NDA01_27880 [Trichocoleus desertorum AS-A10]|uniref:hypothetical protein n=1 Tax=Trichocoleus desertorum TaxID=1481672 RepID=UPI00329803CC
MRFGTSSITTMHHYLCSTTILPTRWEALKEEVDRKNIPIRPLIKPVRKAILEIERELRQVKQTGLGKLFLISGVTGSGKTTFLNSVELFVDNVSIQTIKDIPFIRTELLDRVLIPASRNLAPDRILIIVLEGMETLGELNETDVDTLLTTLNIYFRRGNGRRTLFVIPTTFAPVAQLISEKAMKIGGMTSHSKPFFVFEGPPKSEYITIINETLSVLNDNKTLAEYGVTDEIAKSLANNSESIGQFMNSCYEYIDSKRGGLEDNVTHFKRKRIHLWMLFASYEDDLGRNHGIIRSLTFGDLQKAQIKRLLVGDSQEAKYWESRQGIFGLVSDYLDLRITYLPLRTAVAVLSAYGSQELVEILKQKGFIEREAVKLTARNSLLNNTAVGAFLQGKGFIDLDVSKRGQLSEKQKSIFKEIVRVAKTDDESVNIAIKSALEDWNPYPEAKFYTELRVCDNIICDIAYVTSTDIFCIEVKWISDILQESYVKSETSKRVRDFCEYLPELKTYIEQNQSL